MTAEIDMNHVIEKIRSGEKKPSPFMERLKAIYKKMDEKYNEAANYYGFSCGECEENCCFTRFYHHTFVEYLYLFEGFKTLGSGSQAEIGEKALLVCRQTDELEKSGLPVRLLCPLNYEGLCALYSYRPMICRLHGIPHELTIPGREKALSPGCGEFMSRCGEKKYVNFDRTPFYIEMASLEKEFKAAFGVSERIKLTVAGMLIS
jgi:Fe-S-cluster containining protein